ncbi:hypothetical protein E4U16_005327 [Claviceps sp. LM84 group G4]|nr:hypothetical protein E4U16_005327 [Claviceps sp. LM84 group G4]KAG6085279.1 hypothetical protein E4U33_002070 [Claviceps sp. LM78 group G4]
MQLLSAILVAVAATGAVADPFATTQMSAPARTTDGPDLYRRWCNHGTGGNGGCEANGLRTYCTSSDVPDYTVQYRADPLLRGLPNGDGCFEE